MAEIKRTGESSLEMSIDFPEPEMREEFEAAFRTWYRQYMRLVTTERLVKRLAGDADQGSLVVGDDVSGYILADSAVLREVSQIRRDIAPGMGAMLKFVVLGAIGAIVILAPYVYLLAAID